MTTPEIRINNLKVAIRILEEHQQATKSASLWQSYEEELEPLRKKLGELTHGKHE